MNFLQQIAALIGIGLEPAASRRSAAPQAVLATSAARDGKSAVAAGMSACATFGLTDLCHPTTKLKSKGSLGHGIAAGNPYDEASD